MTKKKITTLLLAAALVLSVMFMIIPKADAAGAYTIRLADAGGNSVVSAKPGDTVSLLLSVENNPGIVSMGVNISYPKGISVVSHETPADAAAKMTAEGKFNPNILATAGNPFVFYMNQPTGTTEKKLVTYTGTLYRITFKIADDAKDGDYKISLAARSGANFTSNVDGSGKIVDTSVEAVSGISMAGCTIKVESPCASQGHSFGSWKDTGDNKHSRTCSVCSATETADHTWSKDVKTQAPTCTKPGAKVYTCSTPGCGATKSESIAKLSHTFGKWANAGSRGHVRSCAVCLETEHADHTWDAGAVTKEATCAEEGVKTYICTERSCGATKTESIAKLSHDFGNWTDAGNGKHSRTCTVCQTAEIVEHAWNAGTVTKEATCAEEGVKTYTCTEQSCGATKTESIAKLSHNFGNWTDAGNGSHGRTCTACQTPETIEHAWDAGTVTKEATCAEDGEKTYTCTEQSCGATKTETIAKTDDHSYGDWADAGGDKHSRTCAVCSASEVAQHQWNAGEVIQLPTCNEEGLGKFACPQCGAKKEDKVPKSDIHVYDNTCDPDCNICGQVHEVSHQYDASWRTNKNEHWYQCLICGDKKDVQAHVPGSEATQNTPQKCTVCEYTINPALGHNCEYGKTWVTDDAGHWYACLTCKEQGSYAAHDFENVCDPDCSVCGYVRQTDHTYDNKWSYDESGHWYACTGCGDKKDVAEHTMDADQCTICRYVVGATEPTEDTTAETNNAETEETGETTQAATEGSVNETTSSWENEDSGNGKTLLLTIILLVIIAGAATLVVLLTVKKKNS